MEVRFEDKELESLYDERRSRRYKHIAQDKGLFAKYILVVNTMKKAPDCDNLKSLSFLHYEKLRHEYSGKSSVRLSNSYVGRLIFTEEDGGITVNLLEIDDTHYGNKK